MRGGQQARADAGDYPGARRSIQYSITGKSIVIKMDVEGYEFNALAGMERTLAENACYVQIELYSERLEELKVLFARFGYRFLRSWNSDHYFTNMTGIG